MKFKKSGSATRRRVKHNPKRRKATRRRVKHNPAPSHVSRRRHTSRRRHARRNPSGFDMKAFGIEVAAAGAGALAAVYINNMAAKWLPARFRGAASILAGGLVVMFGGRAEMVRGAAIGAAGMGLLDLLRSNVPALVPLSAEDAGYLLGSAAMHDESIAAMLGQANGDVPGVLPNVFGQANEDVPGMIPNVFGVDTGSIPMGDDGLSMFGVDTGSIPMGDGEGEYLFADDDED